MSTYLGAVSYVLTLSEAGGKVHLSTGRTCFSPFQTPLSSNKHTAKLLPENRNHQLLKINNPARGFLAGLSLILIYNRGLLKRPRACVMSTYLGAVSYALTLSEA
ncbi:hypothetical protein [Laspinema olomoucense]|uniref:Uncharacterized protein n=1 Tax=Laspinema olomoucense D3b TaxID=2953688 RepID=A0ABT2N0Y8_9CYAN|nr:hypothetical protein [Laspinema sp. D3b]MCT7976342.1 hypothetical protein [Laspinema sp. D3b]